MDVKLVKDNLKFKYRVSGIFIYDNKLLVDKYGDNGYCLPGGYVNMGESSENAIIRELKEEIGLDFKIVNFAGITEDFFVNFRNQNTQAIVLYYRVELINYNDINFIDFNRVEDDNGYIIKHHYKWIELDELDNYNLLPKEIKKDIKNNEFFHHININ